MYSPISLPQWHQHTTELDTTMLSVDLLSHIRLHVTSEQRQKFNNRKHGGIIYHLGERKERGSCRTYFPTLHLLTIRTINHGYQKSGSAKTLSIMMIYFLIIWASNNWILSRITYYIQRCKAREGLVIDTKASIGEEKRSKSIFRWNLRPFVDAIK